MLDDDSERESQMTFSFSSLITGLTSEAVLTAGILGSGKGTSGALAILNKILKS